MRGRCGGRGSILTKTLNWLARTPVIVCFLIATIAIMLSFSLVQQAAGTPLLDTVWTGEGALDRLNEMTIAQRDAHFWGTVINDTLFPLAYCGLLVGITARFSGSQAILAIVPAVLTLVFDFAENTTQALALSGDPGLLGLKSVLTPAKYALFYTAAIIAIGLMLSAGMRTLLSGRRAR